MRSTDAIDFSIGIRLLKHVGDEVKANEPWAILYSAKDASTRYPKYLDDLNSSLVISSNAVEPLKRIYKVIV